MQAAQLQWQDDALLVRAPAKINLSLLIAGKRPDGYHEIDTVMAKVDWHDELLFEKAPAGDLQLFCTGPNWAPQGPENHVFTACRMLAEYTGYAGGIKVTLNKRIPAGTGLGSASSDAAAALIGLNEFASLGISRDELAEMAARIGSDVPFFLNGPLGRCTGRGEKISLITTTYPFSAILVLPSIGVSTKKVYARYEHDTAQYRKASALVGGHLAAGRIDLLAAACLNMLEDACFALHHGLRDLKKALMNLGIGPVCLSGSGSAMYILTGDVDEATSNNIRQLIHERTGCESVRVRNNRW
ncbi:MAG TPA: 4-(cytidine 5'-diphospho)-2-C-methyl-D-erythritol kinase [Sedimentisphaerales bacterium]|nr:4-(cytidine 5'-diphospho)-2-C-methyl-D-erythritol kinase [Sedimentisphaerales bacterium]